jgi:hypothetical protein
MSDGGAALLLQNRQVQISSKMHREKVLAPPAGSSSLLRWARGHCWYPADRVPLCTRLKRSAPRRQTPHPAGEGSGAATCPHDSKPAPGARELWLRHVPRGTEHVTCQERAPVSQRTPRHRARHPAGEDSEVATCLAAPVSSPAQEGSGFTT